MANSFMRNMRLRELGIHSSDLHHVMITRLKSLYQQAWQTPDIPAYACQYLKGDMGFMATAYENGTTRFRKPLIENPDDISYQLHRNAIFDLVWMGNGSEAKVVTGSGDNTSILFNVETLQPIHRYKSHTESVRRVASHPESVFRFASGGRDGNIITWDTRIQTPDDRIVGAHRSGSVVSTSSVIMDLKYLDGDHLMSCGNADCAIKVWDLRKTHSIAKHPKPYYEVHNPKKNRIFYNLVVDAATKRFYATSNCNRIYLYKSECLKPEGWYDGGAVGNKYVRACLSPSGDYLLSGGTDHCAYIWSTKQCMIQSVMPLVKLVGHQEAVTCIDWADVQREPAIFTCSDDNKEFLWTPVDRAMHLMLEEEDDIKMGCAELVGPIVAKKFPCSVLTTTKPNTCRPEETTPIKGIASMSLSQSSSPASSIPDFLQNLPNFLVDGNSPHNKVNREQVSAKENIDWLTQMQQNSGSKEKPKSSGKRRPQASDSGRKRKGKSLLQYFPKVPKTE